MSLVSYAGVNVGCSRTSSGDASLLLSPMRLASLQQLCRIAIRRLLSRDEVEHLLCMPPPIRRYLQYDRQPVSACGWVYSVALLAQLSDRSQPVHMTGVPVFPLAIVSIQNIVLFCLCFNLTNRLFSCAIFCRKYLLLLYNWLLVCILLHFDLFDVICDY